MPLILLVVVGIAFLKPRRVPAEAVALEKYQQMLDEITTVDFAVSMLTPDHSGSMLAYMHASEIGRGLSLLNLKTLERFQIPLTNEVTEVCGWSPDDRYLVFVQTLAPNTAKKTASGLRESWVTLFDRQTGTVRRLTDAEGVFEPFFYWLTTNRYFYVSRWLTNDYAEILKGSLGRDQTEKVCNYKPQLVVMSADSAGCYASGNIFSLEVGADSTNSGAEAMHRLSDFPKGQFDQFKWLRYSRESGRFLFCGRQTNSTWRHLYAFDPENRELKQLSKEDTYNGQWLQGGAGFAYVINTNNGFYLAVRPKEPEGWTNLFVAGGVANYTVAPNGHVIYATASLGTEPEGIWEYDVTSKALRSLSGGLGSAATLSRVVKPEEFKVTSFDGVQVPCFLLSPPRLQDANPNSSAGHGGRRKHPVVIYPPPPSSQFQKSFEQRSQLLANLGFYFLAVNYRGCDGYGREYSALANTPNAARDVMAAYNELARKPDVDLDRVFLFTMSSGSDVVFELMAEAPAKWHGVVLDKPATLPAQGRLRPGKTAPLLIVAGDSDANFQSVVTFEAWARSHGVAASLVVHTNAGHFTFKVNERKDKIDQMGRFFLKHAQ